MHSDETATMLCRAGSCGRAATLHVCVDKRPVATACSQTCAEQIRAQLIGMPKRAADDDANDNRAELDRIRERRQREEQRFRDLKQLLDWIGALCQIRTKVYAMTPLEVSTATMRIGGRFDDDGSTMAAKIDAIIRRGVEIQANILTDVEYDINEIRMLVRELRDVIADEEMINAFDRLYRPTNSDKSQLFGLPDDVQRLVAARANPIQKIAEFEVDSLDPYSKSWANNGVLSIADYTYNYAGQRLSIGRENRQYAPGEQDWVRGTRFIYDEAGYKIIATDAFGWWALASKTHNYTFRTLFNAVVMNDFTHGLVHSSTPGKVYTFPVDFNPGNKWYHLISAGPDKLAALLFVPGVETGRPHMVVHFLTVNRELGTISIANNIDVPQIDDAIGVYASFALDSHGNLWHCGPGVNDRLYVRSPGGELIGEINAGRVNDVCNAEDGVWVTSTSPTHAYRKQLCANYRLAPAAVYNRGLLSS